MILDEISYLHRICSCYNLYS